MALIKCSNCFGMVSTKASACPHCGRPDFELPDVKPDSLDKPKETETELSEDVHERGEPSESPHVEVAVEQESPSLGSNQDDTPQPKEIPDPFSSPLLVTLSIAASLIIVFFKVDRYLNRERAVEESKKMMEEHDRSMIELAKVQEKRALQKALKEVSQNPFQRREDSKQVGTLPERFKRPIEK